MTISNGYLAIPNFAAVSTLYYGPIVRASFFFLPFLLSCCLSFFFLFFFFGFTTEN